MKSQLEKYLYTWPYEELSSINGWRKSLHKGFLERTMPESVDKLSKDSRWPGFFPSAICFVTATNGLQTGLEKVVGATIVNRFPFIVALSFCTKPLSKRHYVREAFMKMIEEGKSVAIQYFQPGECIDKCMDAINSIDNNEIEQRIAYTGLKTIKAQTNDCRVFSDAYMVYEATLVKPSKDFEGQNIFDKPYTDYGSHRIYYLEIEAIQLREDICKGESQIHWRSLPFWTPKNELQPKANSVPKPSIDVKYQKGYSSDYLFPARNTIAFDYNEILNGMCIKYLPALPEDQLEVDDDKARWPCFFPSSVGMISTWNEDGIPNLMPCGSTSILIRHPLCVAICVSYAQINIRYAPRASLKTLLKSKEFICGVPFANEIVVEGIKYAGNVSSTQDKNKISNAGFSFINDEIAPILSALPIHFKCKVVEIVRMGTHFLFLGQIESILVREDITINNKLKWYSYPDVETLM